MTMAHRCLRLFSSQNRTTARLGDQLFPSAPTAERRAFLKSVGADKMSSKSFKQNQTHTHSYVHGTKRHFSSSPSSKQVLGSQVMRQATFDQLAARRQAEIDRSETTKQLGQCAKRARRIRRNLSYHVLRLWSQGGMTQFKILFILLFFLMFMTSFVVLLSRYADTWGSNIYETEEPWCHPNCFQMENLDFLENMWVAWTFIADPGTHADEGTWPRRGAAFSVALVGVIYMSTMIGFISNWMMDVAEMHKSGKGTVEEKGHVLILGWSSSTIPLVEELCIAAESEGGGVIVILAETPKVDIEATIGVSLRRKRDGQGRFYDALRGTRIVVRTGVYSTLYDLEMVQAYAARAIIVQAASGDSDQADSLVLRTILSLKGMHYPCRGYVVAEMRDIDNQLLVKTVGGDTLETIVSHDIIGRLMIKSARVPGLAEVYESVLGFDGCEFYMKTWPELEGMEWKDVFRVFEGKTSDDYEGGAIPLGIHRPSVQMAEAEEERIERSATFVKKSAREKMEKKASQQRQHFANPLKQRLEHWQRSSVMLNPKHDIRILPGDEIIVLAADDDSYQVQLEHLKSFGSRQGPSETLGADVLYKPTKKPELILMCGWRRDLDDIIVLLNRLTPPGSELHMMNTVPLEKRADKLAEGGLLMEDAIEEEICHQLQNDTYRTVTAHNYTLRAMEDPSGAPSLKLVHWYGNASVRRHLREVEVCILRRRGIPEGKIPNMGALCDFDSVLIVADESLEFEPMHSDSHAMATLLLIRELQQKFKRQRESHVVTTDVLHNFGRGKMLDQDCIITSEILDPRTKMIIQNNRSISESSDYILSTHIVSKVLAMVAERKEIFGVLSSLLGARGTEISLEPVGKYFDSVNTKAKRLSFRDLQERVAAGDGMLIGFQQFSENNIAGELILAPKDVTIKRLWLPTDSLILMTGREEDPEYLAHFFRGTEEGVMK